MFEILKGAFLPKEQSNSYNDEDWHLDILKFPIEEKFLESEFPKEIEIIEWIDTKPSKIDRDYYDISWVIEPENKDRPGLFIAFMQKDKFKEAFKKIGKAPEKLCSMKVKLAILKHDLPTDRKSHPEWQCWLEVISAKFIGWVPEN